MSAQATTIDAYLAALPDEQHATLAQLRQTIRSIVPDAAESISYGVPTFKYMGRPLIYIAAAKKHLALYGVNLEPHKQALAAYDTSKGTVRFPANKPPPKPLVTRLLKARVAEIKAAAAAPRRRRA
jgi:uncharacterized protein YdhG (YjbR/CyaY superfamily)